MTLLQQANNIARLGQWLEKNQKGRLSLQEEQQLLIDWGISQKTFDRIFDNYKYSEQAATLNETKRKNKEIRESQEYSDPHRQWRVVINTKTGEKYRNVKLASEAVKMNYRTLQKKLSGTLKNNTDFVYEK